MEVVQAQKKRRLDTGANICNLVNLKKNVVEHNGKSCLHEVVWPPGMYMQNGMLCLNRLASGTDLNSKILLMFVFKINWIEICFLSKAGMLHENLRR